MPRICLTLSRLNLGVIGFTSNNPEPYNKYRCVIEKHSLQIVFHSYLSRNCQACLTVTTQVRVKFVVIDDDWRLLYRRRVVCNRCRLSRRSFLVHRPLWQSDFKETKWFFLAYMYRFRIVRSRRGRDVACSVSGRQSRHF